METNVKREKWLKWEPMPGIVPTFYLKNVKYERNLLTIEVEDGIQDSAPIFVIHFPNFLTFRTMCEGDKLLDSYDYDPAIIEMTKEKRYYCSWSLFRVENSHYLEWFRQQNVGTLQDTDIVHYSIFTPHDLIEVLVPEDCSPTAMWY